MKKNVSIISIFLLVMSACARRMPPPPSAEFSGIINIRYSVDVSPGFESIRGNFRADGFENTFTIVFSDRAGIPRTEIHVQNDSISHKGMEVDEEILELFRYWPLLFYPEKGRKTDRVGFSDILIEYSDWRETVKGKFPGAVLIKAPDLRIEVNIRYGI